MMDVGENNNAELLDDNCDIDDNSNVPEKFIDQESMECDIIKEEFHHEDKNCHNNQSDEAEACIDQRNTNKNNEN